MPKTDHLALTREDIFARRIKFFPKLPKILTEGDSWFDLPFPGRNLIDQFITHYPNEACWLRLETIGDEINQMLSGAQLSNLRRVMNKYRFDAILFSGGGNDMVGENLPQFLTKWRDGMTPEDCLVEAALAKRMARIENDYRALLALRDSLQPGCPIITHSYDYAVPQNLGAKLFGLPLKGPWIWPHLLAKGIKQPETQRAIVKILISRFYNQIVQLSDSPTSKFHVADTRGTLTALEWGDELHPTEEGFQKIAVKVLPLLRTVCPGSFKNAFPGEII